MAPIICYGRTTGAPQPSDGPGAEGAFRSSSEVGRWERAERRRENKAMRRGWSSEGREGVKKTLEARRRTPAGLYTTHTNAPLTADDGRLSSASRSHRHTLAYRLCARACVL